MRNSVSSFNRKQKQRQNNGLNKFVHKYTEYIDKKRQAVSE